ncbi:MAG: serine hydrolase domain-containing protein [Dehalococcoidia bacterium]
MKRTGVAIPRQGGRTAAVVSALVVTLLLAPRPVAAQLNEDRDDFPQQLSMALARNAKQLCSSLWVVGRSREEAMSVGDVTRWEGLNAWWRWSRINIRIDQQRKQVTLSRYPAPPRTAVYHGSQGCTMLPAGEDRVFFDPIDIRPNLPLADSTPWPMGDAPDGTRIVGVNQAAVTAALDAAFEQNNPEKGERGWVVLHDGVIVGERYGRGYDRNTRNLSFSAGKSIAATLMGIVIGDGHLKVTDPAPIAEWKAPDARSTITLKNLLNMSSGLACNNFDQTDPLHFTPQDHHSIAYNDGVDAVQASISVPLRYVPGSVYRYLNCDVMAIVKVLRDTVEQKYRMNWLEFPQRALWDRIGVRNAVVEPDPYGNLIFQGHNYLTTRDWARLGLLYQQRGMFNGQRVLPEGWDTFVSTPSPASATYGAFFWLPAPNAGLPRDAYYMSGAEGQTIMVFPSHALVIARQAWSPVKNFNAIARTIVDAVIADQGQCAGSGFRGFGFETEAECTAYVSRRGTAQAAPMAR